MIAATVIGNLGKDAETRKVGDQNVTSFNVASSSKNKGTEVTTWIRCSIWGKRGDTLAQYLTKGKTVAVSGGLTTREHEGKTYLEIRVDDLKLCGDAKSGGGGGQHNTTRAPSKPSKQSGGGGFSDADYSDNSDDIPFALNVTIDSTEKWWNK